MNISHLRYIVVDSEENALLLENNLIKQYQPRYNILLKDGKHIQVFVLPTKNFPAFSKKQETSIKNGDNISDLSVRVIR